MRSQEGIIALNRNFYLYFSYVFTDFTTVLYWLYFFDSVISKVVSAPENKPSTLLAHPKTPPPPPSPAPPAPVHITPLAPPVLPALPPATISPNLIPPPSPAISATGGSKAPVRSVVTETVSNYVVCRIMYLILNVCCCQFTFWLMFWYFRMC